MSKYFNISFILMALVVVSCAQTPTNPSISSSTPIPSTRATSNSVDRNLSAVDKPRPEHWLVKAKLGIRTKENKGSVSLTWQQKGDDYTIQILSPLGHSKALINGSSDNIIIEQPGKQPLYSSKPIQLIQETFGWSIPLDDFKFWILGTQNPDSPVLSSTFNKQGKLETLEQSRWMLSYSRYKDIDGHQLPAKIRANQKGTRLTMLIREWQLL
jgi:outer membrane lipoprotein LolB